MDTPTNTRRTETAEAAATDMTTTERYIRAQDGFDAVVAAVPDDAWDGPSMCSEWTCRDVLGHVIWGQHLVRHLATGQVYASRVGAPGAPHPGVVVPTDPLGTWRAAREVSLATLTTDALARVVDLPVFGRVPLEAFVTALVTDFLAHTWDIGAAAGLSVRLDPDLLSDSLAWSRAHLRRGPGAIGPELPAPPGADLQTRLLAFLGRGMPGDAATPTS